ncbi:MAG: WD40 repeat domain-containing protein [Anaerolineae bacterium]|nr:WD40 repeat domain-containing protein [Anaerolineae bacterium]
MTFPTWQGKISGMMEDPVQQAVTRLTQELTRTASPDIVRALAEAATRLDDEAAQTGVLAGLAHLTNPVCRDAVWTVWDNTRHAGLGDWLERTGWVATEPDRLHWLTALKVGQFDLFEPAGAEIIELLLRACADPDPTVAGNARLAFQHLKNPAAQTEFFRRVIETDQPLVRELALTVSYTPFDPQQRALFYLLSEQWDKYEALDFDRTLLRTAYQVGNEWLQRRITDLTRRSGRADFVEVLAGGYQRRRLVEMTGSEWAVVLALLSQEQAWSEMWRLAQAAPAVWSAPLLRRLAEAGWQPSYSSEEQTAFAELRRLAEKCSPAGLSLGSSTRNQATLSGHTGAVHDVAISPDGQTLVSAGEDHSLRLWRLPGGESLKTLAGHTGEVWGVAISSDGRLLVSGSDDNSLRLWRLPDGLAQQTWQAAAGAVNALAISPDGHWLASAASDQSVRLWALPKGQTTKTLTGHTNLIIHLAFSPDGRLLASAGRDQTIRLWRVPEGTLQQTLTGHSASVNGLAISPDNLLLASGSLDKTIRLWRLPDGKLLKTLTGHTDAVVGLALSPLPLPGDTGGWLLASASLDQTVRLWRVPEGKPLQTLTGHTEWVTRLAISPDGQWLASASYDQTVRLWASDLARLCHQPVARTSLADLAWVETGLAEKGLSNLERAWLEFFFSLLRWGRRFDIEVETAAPHILIGEFDIQLEG